MLRWAHEFEGQALNRIGPALHANSASDDLIILGFVKSKCLLVLLCLDKICPSIDACSFRAFGGEQSIVLVSPLLDNGPCDSGRREYWLLRKSEGSREYVRYS